VIIIKSYTLMAPWFNNKPTQIRGYLFNKLKSVRYRIW